MSNNPFLPVIFPTTVPATVPGGGWNPHIGPLEDGPSIYANSGPVIYNGQTQTSVINSKIPWASIPAEDGPGGVKSDTIDGGVILA
jgi:hypothetical protein